MTSGNRRQRGFTYIAVLLAVAVIGIGLAATGVVWSQVQQREKEVELMFVGDQFRQAIRFYYERTPGALKRYPQTLEELLADARYPQPQRYLRRLYADPLTGKPEWGLIAAPGGGIMGVYSLSTATPLKSANFTQDNRTFHGAKTYAEWRFFYEAPSLTLAPAGKPTPGFAAAAPQAVARPR
jgi:type II secretory pathway pseudopilin PulG